MTQFERFLFILQIKTLNFIYTLLSSIVYISLFGSITFLGILYGYTEFLKHYFDKSFETKEMVFIRKDETIKKYFNEDTYLFSLKTFLDDSKLLKEVPEILSAETLKDKKIKDSFNFFNNELDKMVISEVFKENKLYNEKEIDKSHFFNSLVIKDGIIQSFEKKEFLDKTKNFLNGVVKVKINDFHQDKFMYELKDFEKYFFDYFKYTAYIEFKDGKIDGKIVLLSFLNEKIELMVFNTKTLKNDSVYQYNGIDYTVFLEKKDAKESKSLSINNTLIHIIYEKNKIIQEIIYDKGFEKKGVLKIEKINFENSVFEKIYLNNGLIFYVKNKEIIFMETNNHIQRYYYNFDTIFQTILKNVYRKDGINTVYEHYLWYLKNDSKSEFKILKNIEESIIKKNENNTENNNSKTIEVQYDFNENLSESEIERIKRIIEKLKNETRIN